MDRSRQTEQQALKPFWSARTKREGRWLAGNVSVSIAITAKKKSRGRAQRQAGGHTVCVRDRGKPYGRRADRREPQP